jgi:hypothetical protein
MKEAALPALIGLVFIISTKTRYPLVKTFLYNDKILNVEKISAILEERGNQKKFEKTLRNGSYIFAASYFIFAALNYVIAKMIVVSATGTPEFNVEIGKMHVVSFVVITLPSMIFLAVTLYYIFRDIKLFTGLSFEEAMHDSSNS